MERSLASALEEIHDVVMTSDFGFKNVQTLTAIESLASEMRSSGKLSAASKDRLASIVAWARILYSETIHRRWDSETKSGAEYVRLELLLEIERLRLSF